MESYAPFHHLLTNLTRCILKTKEIHLKLIETSDIHGNFFPYNFVTDQPSEGSLARVCALLEKLREKWGDRLVYIDNGDILQGQPTAYYYDFVDTQSEHLAASMLNYLHCDVGNMGNHDIEGGHAVYDRWVRDCRFPVLGANVIDVRTGKPYLTPYVMLERAGVRIAVFGMITPAIPMWLPENLWSGLHFEDMEECARQWVPYILEREKPDVLVGVFHAGRESVRQIDFYNEDATLDIARNVPGFDVILIGHDHRRFCDTVTNTEGRPVWIVNPAHNGVMVGEVDIRVSKLEDRVVYKKVSAKLTRTGFYGVSEAFMQHFADAYETVKAFVSRRIGTVAETLKTEPAYFGPSAFIDFIHRMQLELTHADISFCAPLSYDAIIRAGDVYMRDMFNLYRYENMLYTMLLTGREVKDYLEYSYTLWTNRMQTPADHIMLLAPLDNAGTRYGFRNFAFNFDSAAGICYTVDVTRPQGEKVTSTSMADRRPFDTAATYRVAINSYRGNGGGELLTIGAGIPKEELATRIVEITPKDLRYYLMKYIERQGTVSPKPLNQWKFIPEAWTGPAIERDRKLLFGK